ncbi:ribonuclease HI [Lyngbya confervoides]|uniref:Ribonuclease H n=1 Tax=Lyngbya confervoides BDU141951 TaxID=1574623 RepID=A0ABD4SY79_9CYAN|nr:ribonuclease HI [Lyngbya confervoides]MCM1981421.1 ribonuclease HI [Lyngbya confervoides BDU141951]
MSGVVAINCVYTDGACSGNPGPGGWAVVAYFEDGSVQEMGGFEAETTNNRMELQAAIAALQFIAQHPSAQRVELYTDSEYVKKGATQWLEGWKRRSWKTAQGKPVLNQDLWMALDRVQRDQVDWFYVKGHSGNPGNERCDQIARGFAQDQTFPLNQPAGGSVVQTSPSSQPVLAQSHSSLLPMMHSHDSHHDTVDISADQARMQRLQHLLETLKIAQDIAQTGFLITSSELADLMHVHPSAVTSRGEAWVWRNWTVSRVRRESNQILWQLQEGGEP